MGESMNDLKIDLEKQLTKLGKDIQHFVQRIVPLEDKGYDFTPDCDIIESDKTYVIKLDLPGMSKNEVNISLKEQVLTVKGERTEEIGENEIKRRHERSTGVFSRSFALPANVDTTKVDAKFRTGVLTITMPKTGTPENSTSIPI